MDKVQALHSFWSQFGIKAYDESTVPDDAKMPYITYEVSVGDFGDDIASSASVWYYDDGWQAIENKVKQIDEVLSDGGVCIPYDDGNIWIKRSSPYKVRVADLNDMVRRYMLNVIIEYH